MSWFGAAPGELRKNDKESGAVQFGVPRPDSWRTRWRLSANAPVCRWKSSGSTTATWSVPATCQSHQTIISFALASNPSGRCFHAPASRAAQVHTLHMHHSHARTKHRTRPVPPSAVKTWGSAAFTETEVHRRSPNARCLRCAQDEANRNGGKWILRLKKGLAARYWEDLVRAGACDVLAPNDHASVRCAWLQVLGIISEQFDSADEICGAVVSIRYQAHRSAPHIKCCSLPPMHWRYEPAHGGGATPFSLQEDIISVWNRSFQDQTVTLRIRSVCASVSPVVPLTGAQHPRGPGFTLRRAHRHSHRPSLVTLREFRQQKAVLCNRDTLKRVLGLPPSTVLEYKCHDDSRGHSRAHHIFAVYNVYNWYRL